ncbi:uncharacterized protein BX664DRAFT_339189 [Halteromyces radiatus]|uniref:uncharacterized protein n=1 Tax=Halteromyces radiatus TaxID=101107 RepID=UPI0022201633|nr:uncharacterized protein BX664DRAFT_339189 [Halteromyces radiatus]KAI8082842.1 hypothetical protein BX664DRAFT_339189 [Halteromyces radiatus]
MGRFQTNNNKKKPTTAATKSKSKKSKEPSTFEEFMEDAVGFEEQGERYASGDRAQRNYERALDMYSKAHALNDQDADCLYNWGRVLFILVGFLPAHAAPEEKLIKLDESIERFRHALRLESHNKTDVEFNLAQALHLRSELLQESSEIENAYTQSALALQEAISLFDTVYELQEKEYLRYQNNKNEGDQTTTETTKNDACTANHKDEHVEKDITNDKGTTEDNNQFTTVTQMEATTAYSLIDTLLSTADAMTTMASMMAVYADSQKLFSRAREKLSRAEKWLAETDETDKEYIKARSHLLLKRGQSYCALADRAFLATGKVDAHLYEQALIPLERVTEDLDPKNVEALCDQGDVLSRYAQAIVDEADQQKSLSQATGKDIWQLYSKASEAFQKALKLESKNLHILNKAGDISMARAQLPLPVAERNQVQLLKNAQFYYKQAVETDAQQHAGWIGWSYATWALGAWADVDGKEADARKIFTSWLKRAGGNEDLFQRLTEDNDTVDGGFVNWVGVNFFGAEEDEETDDDS